MSTFVIQKKPIRIAMIIYPHRFDHHDLINFFNERSEGLEWFSVTYEMSEEANYEKTKFIARWKKRLGPFTDDYWDYNYCKPLQVLYPSRLEARKIFENDANINFHMKTQSTTEPEIPRELTEEQKQRKRERNRHVNMTPEQIERHRQRNRRHGRKSEMTDEQFTEYYENPDFPVPTSNILPNPSPRNTKRKANNGGEGNKKNKNNAGMVAMPVHDLNPNSNPNFVNSNPYPNPNMISSLEALQSLGTTGEVYYHPTLAEQSYVTNSMDIKPETAEISKAYKTESKDEMAWV